MPKAVRLKCSTEVGYGYFSVMLVYLITILLTIKNERVKQYLTRLFYLLSKMSVSSST